MATRQHPDRAMHPSRRSRDGTRPALATKSVRVLLYCCIFAPQQFDRCKGLLWVLRQDGFVFVFGGWNGEAQFNDLFMLDVENKVLHPRRLISLDASLDASSMRSTFFRILPGLVRPGPQLECAAVEHGIAACRGSHGSMVQYERFG